jgi:hypothetical protein
MRFYFLYYSLCDVLASVLNYPKYHSKWVEEEVLCNETSLICEQGQCEKCNNGQNFFFRHPIPNLDDKEDNPIRLKVWVADPDTHFLIRVDETLPKSAAISRFETMLPKFIRHHSIKCHQANVYQTHLSYIAREDNEGCFLMIHFDYAENFQCASQDQIQAAYYCQRQISLFTVVVTLNTGKKSLVLVSNDLNHGKEAVITNLLYLFEVKCMRTLT